MQDFEERNEKWNSSVVTREHKVLRVHKESCEKKNSIWILDGGASDHISKI